MKIEWFVEVRRAWSTRWRGRLALACALCLLAGAARAAPAPGLVIGTFRLIKVVDGDTLVVDGLPSSLRLLGIDTEETFKTARDRRAAAAGLAAYMAARRGASPRPVKMATPMGEAAKQFAVDYFAGVREVRLERDDPAEVRDRYRRYLAYVFVRRGDRWDHYNVAAVRAGMAPYFPKYGHARRFHAELVAAEAEAKQAGRGIWAPGAPGYPDYAEREAWWAARAAFVDEFRAAAAGDPRWIDLVRDDAMDQLAARVGDDVAVLGLVGEVRPSARGPTEVILARQLSGGLPLVFFDRELAAASGIDRWLGEFVVVTGRPQRYAARPGQPARLELVIRSAAQLRLSPVPGLVPPGEAAP
jgi:endonuclease YncB( thermonuclease family)